MDIQDAQSIINQFNEVFAKKSTTNFLFSLDETCQAVDCIINEIKNKGGVVEDENTPKFKDSATGALIANKDAAEIAKKLLEYANKLNATRDAHNKLEISLKIIPGIEKKIKI